jgi:type II secretory pathway predicted ATPase ExeA
MHGAAAGLSMYEGFFHLRKSPFGMNPDPSCLFMTTSHREALAGLLYAIHKRKGFVVLTGDAGTGKTTLLRALIQSVENVKFSLILTPRVNSDEFLELALLDFGVVDVPAAKSKRIAIFQDLLSELNHQGKSPVLMVDEAHTLSPETLEEIRLLTNFETSDTKLLQIVLAGQQDLGATLNRDDLRQLKQRVEVRMDLRPLAASEVGAYIQHRWTHANGSNPPPFTIDAIDLIARASRGIPRLVNSICDNALLLAYASEDLIINTSHISQVLNDLDLSNPGAPRSGLARARSVRRAPAAGEVRPSTSTSTSRRPYLRVSNENLTEALEWTSRLDMDGIKPKRGQS